MTTAENREKKGKRKKGCLATDAKYAAHGEGGRRNLEWSHLLQDCSIDQLEANEKRKRGGMKNRKFQGGKQLEPRKERIRIKMMRW